MIDLDQTPLPPEVAIEHLAESRYGFSLVDLGIMLQDLADFDQIEIVKKDDYNRCGEFELLEAEMAPFLQQLGDNDPMLVQRVARRIGQIARQILAASGKQTAWVCLRASLPLNANKTFQWHFDWPYYVSEEGETFQYRFVMTLQGPTTLFYPLPVEDMELRAKIFARMNNHPFTNGLCGASQALIFPREVGVVFINKQKGALHSEPPAFQVPRLFLSIVPCSEEQMVSVATRVKEYFRKR